MKDTSKGLLITSAIRVTQILCNRSCHRITAPLGDVLQKRKGLKFGLIHAKFNLFVLRAANAMSEHTLGRQTTINTLHYHCSPLLHSSAISSSQSSICERRVVKRLSFARADDLVTHMMTQITNILNRSTSTTGPTITGIMSCKFKPPVDMYISV